MYSMDVLSVSEAWAVAQEIFGETMLYENATSYYSSVAQLMQAQGWTAVTKGSEVLYYTRPAQVALSTGVKTYTQVAEVTSATVAESGAVTGATATTTGVGVTVAEAAIGGAVAACFGYNVGNKIYEANPEWWDGLLNEVNEWTVENVPEGGVNAIVTVLEGVDTVLTFPSDLIEKIKNYSIKTNVFDYNTEVNIPSSVGTITVTNPGSSFNFFADAFEKFVSAQNLLSPATINYGRTHLIDIYNDFISIYSNNLNSGSAVHYKFIAQLKNQFACYIGVFTPNETYTINSIGSGVLGNYVYLTRTTVFGLAYAVLDTYIRKDNTNYGRNEDIYIGYCMESPNTFFSSNLNSFSALGIEGITVQDDATYPSSNIPISETYPDWWNRRKPISNGEGSTTDWLPVSIPALDPVTLGNPQTQVQAQSGTDTDTENNPNVEVTDSSGVSNKDNNPDSTDNGNTPIVPPLTSLYGIAGIYNPTLEQITSFSNWLWSENPITQLQQMFSNPMNAIIGLHLIYATPHTSSEKMIGVGYLSSGVLSKVVDEQYITIDCGTIDIPSYYNNVNDWNPYTKITCYLPFIGMVKLNTDDLMSSKDKFSQLNITYKVDVLTGACLAMLKVKRGNSDAVLYQYNGSCSVQLPLTSGNYGSVLASLISTVVGGASGFAPLAIGGVMGLTHPKADIQRSGQLGANVGAMGIKKPYLIIERPYSKYAGSYGEHIGYPSNNTIKLSACSGFTRVKSTNVNNINTTEEERKMILNLLTDGIYI